MEEENEFDLTGNGDREYKLYTHNFTPERILGDVDANFEWSHFENSASLFVKTDSFSRYNELDIVYLFGRRGTGKSAMIKMLDHQIKNSVSKLFSHSSIVEQSEVFHKIAISVRLSNIRERLSNSDLEYIFMEKWLWIAHVSAFQVICNDPKNKKEPDLERVREYLKTNVGNTEAAYIAVETLTDEIENVEYSPQMIGMALFKSVNKLVDNDYQECLHIFREYLRSKKKRVLIQIDSKERYQYDDEISKSIITALIEAALKIHNANDNIYVKVAFPSEIYPHLSPLNKEKTETRSLFILWKYQDLLSFATKRFENLMKVENLEQDSNEEFNLYSIMPSRIKSYPGIEIDTFAYIVSHSQKKPRQIIQIFNNILTLAKRNSLAYNKLSQDLIKEGVNCRMDILSSGTLNMYDHLFPNATKIAKKVFSKAANVFTQGELDHMILEASSYLKGNELTKEDMKRMFLEAGIIGKIISENLIQSNKNLITAEFEYQIKGTMTINNRIKLALHPMYYQEFETKAMANTLIYPVPSEYEKMEEEILRKEINE